MPEFILNIKAVGSDVFSVATKEVEKSLDRIKGTALGLDNVVSKLRGGFATALTVTGIARFTLGLVKSAEEMEKLSRATGGSIEFLSALKAGASETGIEVGGLVSTYEAFVKRQQDFQAGIGRSRDSLRALRVIGLTPLDLQTKKSEELFTSLIKRIQQVGSSAELNAAGVRLFGESFREAAAAAEKGLGDLLARRAPSALQQSNQELLAEAGDQLNALGGRGGSKLKTVGSSILNGLVTGVGGFVGGSAATMLGGLPGFMGDWFSKQGSSLLTGAFQTFNPLGTTETKARAQRLKDQEDSVKSRGNIASISEQIRDDAEDVLEELEARNGRREDYESVLRRAQRQKKREANRQTKSTISLAPKGDELSRLGLFVGQSGVRQEITKQTARLVAIHRELQKVNTNIKK